MTSDEEAVAAIHKSLEERLKEKEQAECDFFNKASDEVKEQYFKRWREVNDPGTEPRFIREYAEARRKA